MKSPDGVKDTTLFPSISSATTPLLHFNMYKSMSLLVLVALAACVVSMETQDQETAEQYFRIHGVYPSWYPYGVRAYPYTGYPAATAYTGYPAVAAYPAAAYTTNFAGVKNVVSPYAAYPYAYNTYPYGAYGAVPYVAAAPAATPVKA